MSGNNSRCDNRLGWVLPRPSAVSHTYASVDTPWVAQTLSHCTLVKWGNVSSNSPTYEATQLGDSICPICISTFRMLVQSDQQTRSLIDTGRGYHLGVLNLWSRPLSTFPSSILHFLLIGPSVSNYANHSITFLNRIGPPSTEMALSWADSNHSSSTDSLHI
jgi:hypothetical protein